MSIVINTIGVLSGVLTMISFGLNELQVPSNKLAMSLKIGLDGARPPSSEGDGGPLSQAGGRQPWVVVFNERGKRIGETLTTGYCESGDDDCRPNINMFSRNQPTYAYLSGMQDAVCIAAAGVTFPGGERYGWVGNWARECGAAWYYSDSTAKTKDGSTKLLCAWLDRNNNVPTTTMQIHWTEFNDGFPGNGNDAKYCCQQNPAYRFAAYPERLKNLSYWTADPGSQMDVTPVSRCMDTWSACASRRSIDNVGSEDVTARIKRTLANDARVIRSPDASHSAKELCNDENSAGPSFASLEERAFCHMPGKTLYQFCDNDQSDDCWDDKRQKLSLKGDKEQARGVVWTRDPMSRLPR